MMVVYNTHIYYTYVYNTHIIRIDLKLRKIRMLSFNVKMSSTVLTNWEGRSSRGSTGSPASFPIWKNCSVM